MGGAQHGAGHRLAGAGGALARFQVAGKFLGEGLKPRQHHVGRLPTHGAIAGFAQQLGGGAQFAQGGFIGFELSDVLQNLRHFRHTLCAGSALSAGLRQRNLQLPQHHAHRTGAGRHGFRATGKGGRKLANAPVRFRGGLHGYTTHRSLFLSNG